MLTQARLESLLGHLPHLRIALLGDLFLDRYLELAADTIELSIETGLEAYQISTVRNSPGALGTVMNNLAALGVGQLVPVTVLGSDGHGYDLRLAVNRLPADLSHVVVDPHRLTPTYTKPMRRDSGGFWRELNRLDVRSREPLAGETIDQLIGHLRQAFETCDGLIVLDQINEENWGVVNRDVRDALDMMRREQPGKLVFVDSRRHLGRFRGGVLKGNRAEILAAAGRREEGERELRAAIGDLAERTCEPVYCTAGEAGIYVGRPGGEAEWIAGFPVAGPVDIVGAGDAATSGIVTALLAGMSFTEAAMMGNLVASITVQQLGTTGTASPAQVRARWNEVADGGWTHVGKSLRDAHSSAGSG
jgi:bifunctional ADP-heptose synthase (sugar kinase/adenylyltransferase)